MYKELNLLSSFYSALFAVCYSSPQIDDEVVSETKTFQVWVVNCLSKIHGICFACTQIVNLHRQLVVVDTKKWIQ